MFRKITTNYPNKDLKILVIKEFFNLAGTVYLTVRAENKRANNFYKKIGMKQVGYCNWSNGNMKGKVWKYG